MGQWVVRVQVRVAIAIASASAVRRARVPSLACPASCAVLRAPSACACAVCCEAGPFGLTREHVHQHARPARTALTCPRRHARILLPSAQPPAAHAGTHIFQPTSAFVPIAPPRGLTIICHPPLAVPITKKEQASTDECRATVISALPLEMQPAPRAAE